MRDLFNKVSDLLKVRNTLECIAADTNCLNIYSHIYEEYRKQNHDIPTTKRKIKFYKVLQSLSTAKYKIQIWYIPIFIHLVETFALILISKIVFEKLF